MIFFYFNSEHMFNVKLNQVYVLAFKTEGTNLRSNLKSRSVHFGEGFLSIVPLVFGQDSVILL